MKTRILMALVVTAAFAIGVAIAQAPAAFDVASIRPAASPFTESGQLHAGAKIEGAHLDFGYVSLWDLLPYALRVKPYAIVRPDWSRDSHWNILANLPEGTGKPQAPDMMRALLTERFKLSFHHEPREQPTQAPPLPRLRCSGLRRRDRQVWPLSCTPASRGQAATRACRNLAPTAARQSVAAQFRAEQLGRALLVLQAQRHHRGFLFRFSGVVKLL